MRSGSLHHWDLHTGTSSGHAARELVQKAGEAALALAGELGGAAVDVLGFRTKYGAVDSIYDSGADIGQPHPRC